MMFSFYVVAEILIVSLSVDYFAVDLWMTLDYP